MCARVLTQANAAFPARSAKKRREAEEAGQAAEEAERGWQGFHNFPEQLSVLRTRRRMTVARIAQEAFRTAHLRRAGTYHACGVPSMVRTQTVLQHLKIMHDMQRQTLPAELKRRQTRGNDGWALNMPTVLRRHIHQHRDGRAVAYTRYRRCVLRGAQQVVEGIEMSEDASGKGVSKDARRTRLAGETSNRQQDKAIHQHHVQATGDAAVGSLTFCMDAGSKRNKTCVLGQFTGSARRDGREGRRLREITCDVLPVKQKENGRVLAETVRRQAAAHNVAAGRLNFLGVDSTGTNSGYITGAIGRLRGEMNPLMSIVLCLCHLCNNTIEFVMQHDPWKRNMPRKPLSRQRKLRSGEAHDRLKCMLEDTAVVACRPSVLTSIRDYHEGVLPRPRPGSDIRWQTYVETMKW